MRILEQGRIKQSKHLLKKTTPYFALITRRHCVTTSQIINVVCLKDSTPIQKMCIGILNKALLAL